MSSSPISLSLAQPAGRFSLPLNEREGGRESIAV